MGQTTFNQNPDVAVPGLLADSGIDYVVTRINKAVAQVITVTIASVDNSTEYVVTLNGVPCSFTSDASATEAEINAGLLAAINDSAFNGADLPFNVTAVQGATTATIIITANVAGEGFTYAVTAVQLTVALTTANSGAVPFGVGVAQGSEDDLGRLPIGSGDTIVGISVLDQTEPNQIRTGVHEYQAGDAMGIARQGRVWVYVEDAVATGGDVYIRHTATGNGSQLGAARSDNDGGAAAQLTSAVFDTTQATPGGLAVINLNRP
jgi:hypothetical protein